MISYKIFILLLMLLMHYIEDFHLQGCMANLKQKKWWREQMSNNNYVLEHSIYKNDYKMGLFAHSIENALFVMLPLIIDLLISEFKGCIRNTWILFIPSTLLILVSHYLIDNEKANKKEINLIQDQLYHLGIILLIFISYFWLIGEWYI